MPRPSAVVLLAALSVTAAAADKPAAGPQRLTVRVTGLFLPQREAALREAVSEIPGVSVAAVDFDAAELTVECDPAKAFPGTKPDKLAERFDQILRQNSRGLFGVKPRRTLPLDKLERVEIAVAGLDCLACSLAAYEAVARIDGVEQATASFKDGKVTARIDPAKTNRAALEAALKQRNVTVLPR